MIKSLNIPYRDLTHPIYEVDKTRWSMRTLWWKVLSSRTKAWSWGSWNPSIKTRNGVAFFVVASIFLFLEDSGSTDKENSDYYDDGPDFVRNHDLAEHCQHYHCRCSKLLVLSDWKYFPSIVCLQEKYFQSTYFLGYKYSM